MDRKKTFLLSIIPLFAILIAGIMFFIATPVLTTRAATTYTVTNASDSGSGSLKQTILDAMNYDVINFDSSLAGKTIIISNTIRITESLTIDGSDLDIPVQISGGKSWCIPYHS